MDIKKGEKMRIDNIDVLIKSCKKLTNISDDMIKGVRSLAKTVTTREAVYLHYLLNSIGSIGCVIEDIHEVVENEMNDIEDELNLRKVEENIRLKKMIEDDLR